MGTDKAVGRGLAVIRTVEGPADIGGDAKADSASISGEDEAVDVAGSANTGDSGIADTFETAPTLFNDISTREFYYRKASTHSGLTTL